MTDGERESARDACSGQGEDGLRGKGGGQGERKTELECVGWWVWRGWRAVVGSVDRVSVGEDEWQERNGGRGSEEGGVEGKGVIR